jgi:hypothetical protein
MGFQDILNSIHEETDRTQMAALAGKYPSMRTYLERGERFEAVAPRLRAVNPRFAEEPEALVENVEAWESWRRNNWDNDAGMTREERRRAEALNLAELKIAELEMRGDTDMTSEEIAELVAKTVEGVLKTKGVVTAEDLNNKLSKEFVPELNKNFNNMLGNFEGVFADLGPLTVRHEREFGEEIDPQKVFNRMREANAAGHPITAKQAYAEVYKPKLDERAAAAEQKKIEDAEKRGEIRAQEKFVKEGGVSRSNPVGEGSGRRLGPMQRRQMERAAANTQQGGTPKLGRGNIAAQAGEEYRAKQMAGATA